MATKRLEVLITGNAKDAQRAFGALGDSAEKGGKRTTKALSGIQSGLIGLGVGAAALGSFKAFEESEKIARQTDAVIKSTGNEANVTEGHISDLASEMSKLGGVDDELVQQGENMLLTFTKVRNEAGKGNDVFDQATRAANDYAAATGTDVVNANKMLGKALNDPIKGLTALTRAGVSFTQQQKDQIRALVDAGDTLGAQKIILAEFNKEYGGSLEANATASGKAQVAMENLGESAGAILAPGLELLAGGAAKAAEGLSGLPVPAQQAIIGVTGLTTAAVIAGPKVVEMAGMVADGAKAISGFAKSSEKVGKATSAIGSAVDAIGGVGTVAPVAAAGLGIVAAGFVKSQIEAQRTKEDVSDLLDMIQDGMKPTEAAAAKLNRTLTGVEGGFQGLAGSSKDMRRDLEELGYSTADAAKLIALPADEWKRMRAEILKNKVGDSPEDIYNLVDNLELMREKMREAGTQTKDLKQNSKALAEAGFKAVEDASGKAGEATRNTTEFYKENADALQRIADEAEQATSNIRDFYDESTNQVSDQIDVERALDAASQSFKDNGTALSISAEKGRQNREAIIAARDAQVEYAMTLRDTSGSNAAIESMVNYSNRLYDTMVQAGFTKEQAAALIGEMGLTPKDIYTTFRSNATEAEQRAADVRQSIQNVPGWKDIYFNALTDEAKAKIAELSQIANKVGGSVLSGTAGAAIQQSAAAHGRWGAVTAYAKGGITPAHITRDQLFKYGEPATGGEAFVPRNGDKKRSMSILGEAAGWYGMQVVPMRRGGVIYEDEAGWDWRTMGNRRRGPVSRPMQSASFGSASPKVNPGPRTSAVGGAGAIVVQLLLDGRQISQVVVNDVNRQARMGRSPLVGV